MGLLKGVVKIIEIIYSEAEKEFLDETPYRQALDDLYVQLENGEITEEEYEIEEAEIVEALKEIRQYKKEHEIVEE